MEGAAITLQALRSSEILRRSHSASVISARIAKRRTLAVTTTDRRPVEPRDVVATQDPNWLAPWWKALPKRWGHRWHAMCSYLAMFPPGLPRYFIEQCSLPGDVVLDPFSGRGTTPLEACLAGRIGVGSDANPLAAVLTAAKVCPPTKERALERLSEIERSYARRKVDCVAPPEIKMLFDGRRTLPQLLYIRQILSHRSRCDTFLLAALLGILHGNHPKRPTLSRTLSISMPNTFSMSPSYIERYKRREKLRKYPFDVFDLLRRRLNHLFHEAPPRVNGRAKEIDARAVDKWLPRASVSLIVTSPPYLRVVRYGKFNWIRLWLLKSSVENLDRRLRVEATDNALGLSDRLTFPSYCSFLREVTESCSRVLKPGGQLILVIGDVRGNDGEDQNLGQGLWKEIRRSSPLRLVDIIEDKIEVGAKVTRIWGSKKGTATKTDRVIVLKKPGHRAVKKLPPSDIIDRLIR